MKPCEKYQGLVVGPDGQTVADPFGIIPTLGDYEEWRAVTATIITRVERELVREQQVTGVIDSTNAAMVANLSVRWEAMGSAIVQSFDFNFTWAPAIVEMVDLARDAACLLGEVEARVIAAGGGASSTPAAPVRPAEGKSVIDQALSLAFLGGAVFGLYWLSQRGKTTP